jgi:para-aminobenzoate synthetase/4-amino-4-deoxychorismate lyase
MTGPWARFDDVPAGEALRCPPPRHVLTADTPGEVGDVLREVDDATATGDWAFGYVSYEAAAGLDPSLPGGWTPGQPPLVWFGICGEPTRVEPVTVGTGGPFRASAWRPDWTDGQHADAVARVREHIAAGDTYQCNLTDRLRASVTGSTEALYGRLTLAQRGAYNAYLDLGEVVFASASPELFFEWVDDRIRTRPMKGTARRGRTTAEDEQLCRALTASSKERAENLMIVDLLRNDLARISVVGSVCVDELFALEPYPTVWQLASQVSARLRPGTGLLDIFRALFPCGSVTGAPKRRTMQLIRDLEPGPRGVYCGAVGLVAPPSAPFRARFNVAIRTAVVDRRSGQAVYGAGGGITWGSTASRERAELWAKAAVLSYHAGEHQLIETLAFVPGQGEGPDNPGPSSSGPGSSGLRNLDRHLARMAESAAWFGFRCDLPAVASAVHGAVRDRTAPARVRILLARDGRVDAECAPLPAPPDRPVRLVVDREPVDSADPWLHHKTTRREVYEVRARRHPEADDVVLINEQGEITETTIANLALRLDGRWWTPPTSCGCLPGVERARLVALGRMHERRLCVGDLHRAESIVLVSSLRGWREAVLADVR